MKDYFWYILLEKKTTFCTDRVNTYVFAFMINPFMTNLDFLRGCCLGITFLKYNEVSNIILAMQSEQLNVSTVGFCALSRHPECYWLPSIIKQTYLFIYF